MSAPKFIENSALIVGSAPDARALANCDIPNTVQKIAVNNAWKLRPDFHIHICPNDFPDNQKPPKDYKARRVQNVGYTPALRRAGGTMFCGATMAFCAGYYTLNASSFRIITFFGCNMVYQGAETHFYGKGQPDPIKVEAATYASIKNLKAKASRMFLIGLLMDTLMINIAPHPNGNLTIPTTRYSGDITNQYKEIMADTALHDILVRATANLMKERKFPGDRHSLNLTPISTNALQMQFIDQIDQVWESLGAEAIAITDKYLT